MRRLAILFLSGLLALALLASAGFVVWAETGYRASAEAEEASEQADEDTDGWYAFGAAGDPSVGVVLYPGGRVDPAAYALVARRLSRESGVLVAVIRAPLHFAIFDPDAAEPVMAAHPGIERWIVGGHSLGGVAAASFAGSHPSRVDGLLLWASYPSGSTDLSQAELEVTSIYGGRDGVLNRDSLEEARSRLPASTVYVKIEGANHAYFGDYGAQGGDSSPTIPREEAQAEIIAASSALVRRVGQQ